MEPVTLLIGVSICVASAVIIYLISIFSMPNTTKFDEAFEEQLRLGSQLISSNKKSKQEKPDKKKKKSKEKSTAVNKEKQNVQNTDVYQASNLPENVTEEKIEEVISYTSAETLSGKPDKKNKKAAHSNTGNSNSIKAEIETKKNPNTEIYPDSDNKNNQAPIVGNKTAKKQNTVPNKPVQKEIIKEEVISLKQAAPVSAQPQPVKSTKKKGKESPAKESSVIKPVSKTEKPSDTNSIGDNLSPSRFLLSSLRTAKLSDNDLQSLLDILVDKHGVSSNQLSWKKKSQKQDPSALVAKQMDVMQTELNEEKSKVASFMTHLKQLKSEVASSNAAQRFAEKALASKEEENQALRRRMDATHGQHSAEVNNLRKQLEMQSNNQNAQVDPMTVQRLVEENQRLKEAAAQHSGSLNAQQQLNIMQAELAKNVNLVNSEKGLKEQMERKVARLEDQMKKLENDKRDGESRFAMQLADQKKQVGREEANKVRVMQELQVANERRLAAENDLQALRAKPVSDPNIETQLQNLKEENQSLLNELKSTKERTAGEGQESPSTTVDGKDDVKDEDKNTTESSTIDLSTHKLLLDEKNKQIAQLSSEIESYCSDLELTKNNLEIQLKKNNEAQTEQGRVKDLLSDKSKEINDLQAQIDSQQQELQKYRDNESSQSNVEKLEFEVKNLEDKLTKQKEESLALSERLQSVEGSNGSQMTSVENSKLIEEISSLKKENETSSQLNDKLKSELKQTRAENTALRQGCEQATMSLSAAEKEAEEIANIQAQLKDSVTMVTKLEQQLAEAESKSTCIKEYKEKLGSIFPTVSITNTCSDPEWLSAFEDQVLEYLKELGSAAESTKEENSKLESEVQHYKSILSDTELILTRLQSSVEAEETNWTQKLASKEDELRKAAQELEKLQSELKHLSSNTEMEDKVEMLEERLSSSLSEKEELQTKMTEMMTSTGSSKKEVDELKSKISSLQKQLEKESATNKQLTNKLDASASNHDGTSV